MALIVAGRPTSPDIHEIADALRPLLPAGCAAYLFGSRATGQAREASDWDVGLVGSAPLDGATVERVREALEELPTLHTFDVVDLLAVPEGFRALALAGARRIV